jgi:hypothetical protein
LVVLVFGNHFSVALVFGNHFSVALVFGNHFSSQTTFREPFFAVSQLFGNRFVQLLKFSGTIFRSRSSFREPLFPVPRRLQKLKLMRLLDAKTVCLWKSKFDIDRRFKVQPGLQAILHKAPVLFKVV